MHMVNPLKIHWVCKNVFVENTFYEVHLTCLHYLFLQLTVICIPSAVISHEVSWICTRAVVQPQNSILFSFLANLIPELSQLSLVLVRLLYLRTFKLRTLFPSGHRLPSFILLSLCFKEMVSFSLLHVKEILAYFRKFNTALYKEDNENHF